MTEHITCKTCHAVTEVEPRKPPPPIPVPFGTVWCSGCHKGMGRHDVVLKVLEQRR